jgi:hypothetical protein
LYRAFEAPRKESRAQQANPRLSAALNRVRPAENEGEYPARKVGDPAYSL